MPKALTQFAGQSNSPLESDRENAGRVLDAFRKMQLDGRASHPYRSEVATPPDDSIICPTKQLFQVTFHELPAWYLPGGFLLEFSV